MRWRFQELYVAERNKEHPQTNSQINHEQGVCVDEGQGCHGEGKVTGKEPWLHGRTGAGRHAAAIDSSRPSAHGLP
eukprot:scaffold42485_cov50-Attheya_sp.AAC.10